MQKIWIILKSEFGRRVRTRRFVLTTLLAPFGLIAFTVLMGALGFFAAKSSLSEHAGYDPPVEERAAVEARPSSAAPASSRLRRALMLDANRELQGDTEQRFVDASSVVGHVMGFIIYLAVLFYGVKVMQGVIEEKTSRVAEVVVSSVRPFELLMGKVLGIGAMGLLQMTLWGLLLAGVAAVGSSAMPLLAAPAGLESTDGMSAAAIEAVDLSMPHLAPSFLGWFVLFFVGGYLLYATLFAALGSAVDQQQDAQGLNFALVMLLIIPLSCISIIADAPHAPFVVVLSLIPFFAPIAMTVRMAVATVPLWQSVLALLLLAATFVGIVWLSSRIYRVGMLMYGKKASLRELARWVRYS